MAIEAQKNLSAAIEAQKAAVDARDMATAARDVALASQKLAEEERSELSAESAALRKAAQEVCDEVLGVVPGPSSLAAVLAGVPAHVLGSVSEGTVLGASSALVNAISYYDGIDLGTVGSGIAGNRTEEEVDRFELQVEPYAREIADRIFPQNVLHRK